MFALVFIYVEMELDNIPQKIVRVYVIYFTLGCELTKDMQVRR